MQDLPVQMHPKYQEFLKFMAECPYRKTPETMQTAFWAWLELTKVQEFFNSRPDPRNEEVTELKTKLGDYIEESTKTIQMLSIDKKLMKGELDSLKNDLDRLHRERDSFQQQSSAMASENERLSDELMRIKRNIAIALDYGAVSERGDACLAIDGGNL